MSPYGEQLRLEPYDYPLGAEMPAPINGVPEDQAIENSQERREQLISQGFYPALNSVIIEEVLLSPEENQQQPSPTS